MSQEETAPTTQPVSAAPTELPELAVGYVVGLQPDGSFVFEVLGSEPGLVQLMGLNQYASHRITVAKDLNQGYGFPVLAQQINQLGEMLKVMLNMQTEKKKSQIVTP